MLLKIIPRDYQEAAVQAIFDYLSHNREGNPIVAMPTGTGKAVVIALFMQRVFLTWPTIRHKILNLTHVKELVEQNFDKLMTLWPTAPAGVNSAGLNRRDVKNDIIFGGIGSVKNLAEQFGRVDLVLIDECHLVSPSEETMYIKFLTMLWYINPNIRIIGFTATPWRLGHGHLTEGGVFTDVCFDMTGVDAFNWLVEEGYLSPLFAQKPDLILDTSGVHKRGGEFISSELQNAVDKDEITTVALQDAIDNCSDRACWLIFAAGVEHALNIARIATAMGVPTVAIHGDMKPKDRDAAIRDFKSGKYRAAVNNNVLTTGFDYPLIDLLLVLRPTESPVLWVQMLGRGTRPVYAPGYDLTIKEGRLAAIAAGPKQNCLVRDYGGNTRKLGPINDPVIPKKKGEKGGVAPVKLCEKCDTYNHASVRFCSYCGFEFHMQVKIKQAASTQQVVKSTAPIIDEFKVDHITYQPYQKQGRPPSMKVTYYVGARSFNNYICIEHEGVAGRLARVWWKERTDIPVPLTTAEALLAADKLAVPTHIRVWMNPGSGYPEIKAYCFDGTCFSKQAAEAGSPEVQVVAMLVPHGFGQKPLSADDDDIPF